VGTFCNAGVERLGKKAVIHFPMPFASRAGIQLLAGMDYGAFPEQYQYNVRVEYEAAAPPPESMTYFHAHFRSGVTEGRRDFEVCSTCGKGHAFDSLRAGEKRVLVDVEGSGVVRRLWMTIGDQSPEMLRSLRIDMSWDGATVPAVSAPLGDFFGIGLGQKAPFECALFANPEGKSFNCCVPMPFGEAARITITNESARDLTHLFCEFDVNLNVTHGGDSLYFHAHWRRLAKVTPGLAASRYPGAVCRERGMSATCSSLPSTTSGHSRSGSLPTAALCGVWVRPPTDLPRPPCGQPPPPGCRVRAGAPRRGSGRGGLDQERRGRAVPNHVSVSRGVAHAQWVHIIRQQVQ